jgi:hypothetical protein
MHLVDRKKEQKMFGLFKPQPTPPPPAHHAMSQLSIHFEESGAHGPPRGVAQLPPRPNATALVRHQITNRLSSSAAVAKRAQDVKKALKSAQADIIYAARVLHEGLPESDSLVGKVGHPLPRAPPTHLAAADQGRV